MSEDILAIAIIGLIGIGLTATRRLKNNDPNAGIGIAGWTIFLIIMILF